MPGNQTASEGGQTTESPLEQNSSPSQASSHTVEDVEKNGRGAPAGPSFVGFWSPEVAAPRKAYLIGIARITILVSLLVWSAFALYWGSLYREYFETSRLHGWIVNRDPTGVIGQNVSAAVQAISDSPSLGHITWDVIDPNMYTNQQIDYEVAVEEGPWAVLIITQDATQRLETARANGDASYQGTSALTLVYSESRNQQVVPGLVVSGFTNQIQPTLRSISAQLAAQFLTANANNPAALQTAARAPNTISGAVALGTSNLRPYYSNPYNSAVLAATYVGLIYLVILAFNTVMANFQFRQGLSRRLKLSSHIAMRLLVPIIIYFWLSLMFTLLQAAFHLDFNGWQKGYGAGFMVFWMCSWSAMTALGLLLEALMCLVGPAFIAFGLVFVIVANVSGALIPVELAPSFYKYSYAFPFYNAKAIFLHIFTNAGKSILILKHVGILWAWIAVMVLTLPIWVWLERRSQLKTMAAGDRAIPGMTPVAPPKIKKDTPQGKAQ